METGFFAGARKSLEGSMEWIGFYMILFGALLVARAALVASDLFSAIVGTGSAVMGAILLQSKYSTAKPLIVLGVVVLQFSALAHGEKSPYPLQDVILWPAGAWIAAIVVTAIFAGIARFSIFNEDLLPVVNFGWTTSLNRVGAFILMMTALSLLIFFPSSDFLDSLENSLPKRTAVRMDSTLFHAAMKEFSKDLIHPVGIWGVKPLPAIDLTVKDYSQLAVVVMILGVAWFVTNDRIARRNKTVPKGRIPEPLNVSANDSSLFNLTNRLTFLFTFSASAFLFGIYAPIIAAGELSVQIQTASLLAVFLIGGVGAWVSAMAISSRNGVAFVVGVLFGTCFIYALSGGLGFLLFDMVISLAPHTSSIYLFRVFVQVALGSLLIFTSYAVADIPINAASTIKYAACTALLVPAIGFTFDYACTDAPPPLIGPVRPSWCPTDDRWMTGGLYALLTLAALGIPLFGDRLKRRRQSADQLLVVATNTIAIAPFRLGATETIQYLEPGLCSVVSRDSRMTRLRVVDSEEALISYVRRYARLKSFITRRPDVIVSDLLTALTIISRTKKMNPSESERYRYVIRGMLCCLPWRRVRNKLADDLAPRLFPGTLSYSPSEVEIRNHPFYHSNVFSIATGYESILRYCQQGGFQCALLPEPFVTALKLNDSGAGVPIEIDDEGSFSEHPLAELAEKLPYVVLRSTKLKTPDSLRYHADDLEMSLLAATDTLCRNYHATDVVRGAQIADFLNAFSPASAPFTAPCIDRALRECTFGSKSQSLLSFLMSEYSPDTRAALLKYCDELNIIEKSADFETAFSKASWLSDKFRSGIAAVPVGHSCRYPMAVIWVRNAPGKLGEVLSALDLDLVLVSVVSAGDYGLICIIPRPASDGVQIDEPDCKCVKQIELESHYQLVEDSGPTGWETQVENMQSDIADHNCTIRFAFGTLIRVPHAKKGFANAIAALNRDLGGGAINLEGAWAFPSRSGAAYALLFLHESDVLKLSHRA